jgi:uncharacterized protein (DUF58 family)
MTVSQGQPLTFIDPEQLAKIGDLQLLARTVVNGVMTGLHRSPHSGSAIEFAQYRPYTQGEDPKFVDWKLYARTDRLHVKQFQEETNLLCTLVLDCSASMDYSSGPVTKFQYAVMLTAALTVLLHEQRDAFGFIGYHHDLITYVPPRGGKPNLQRVLVSLDNLKPAGRTDAASTLRYLGDVLRPRGMVILVSDLLHPLDEVIDHLKSLRARRHDVLVFQISDEAEQTFPFNQTTTFIDAEDEAERYAVPDAVREGYLENRRKHFEAVRKECLASEIDFEELVTREPLDHALHRYLHHRNNALLTKSGSASRRGTHT